MPCTVTSKPDIAAWGTRDTCHCTAGAPGPGHCVAIRQIRFPEKYTKQYKLYTKNIEIYIQKNIEEKKYKKNVYTCIQKILKNDIQKNI